MGEYPYLLVDAAVAGPSYDVLVVLVTAEVSKTVAEGNVLDELGVVLGHGELLTRAGCVRELVCENRRELEFLLRPSRISSAFICQTSSHSTVDMSKSPKSHAPADERTPRFKEHRIRSHFISGWTVRRRISYSSRADPFLRTGEMVHGIPFDGVSSCEWPGMRQLFKV